MDSKQIYNLIIENNLYAETRTYVELFTDGSYLFWNKNLSFTQYINDVNNKLNDFYKSIRQNKIVENSIYCQRQKFTKDISQIMSSNFYKRLDRTYIFSRDYKDLIKATNDEQTFYYCELNDLNQQILYELLKIKGKFLISCINVNCDIDKNLHILKVQNVTFIYNYNKPLKQDLF